MLIKCQVVSWNTLYKSFIAFLLINLSVACYAQEKVKVGVFENKPIVFKAADGKISGLSIDILTAIADEERWEIEYVHGPFSEIYKQLEANEIDLIVGLAYTEKRNKNLFYTKETLLNNWGIIYQSLNSNITSIEDLQGKRVVLVNKNIHSRVFLRLMEQFGFSFIPVYVDTPQQLFDVMRNEQATAGVINRLASLNVTEKDKLKPTSIIFNPVEVRYASSRKSDTHLVETIDDYLHVWKKDKTSFYFQQIVKWINTSESKDSKWLKYSLFITAVILIIFVIYVFYIKKIVRKSHDDLNFKLAEQSVILESLADGIIIIDEDGIIQYFNHAAEKMFLYEANEIIGQKVNKLIKGAGTEESDSYIDNFNVVKQGKAVGKSRDFFAKRKNNDIFPIRFSLSELPAKNGGEVRFIGMCVDLTLEKQQDKYLQRSQKMEALGQLTGGIAHDYNNMLTVVLGFSEILDQSVGDDSKLKSYVQEIMKAADRGVALTNKLLTFTKSSKIDREEVNVNDLLRDEKMMLEKTLTPRIQLKLDLEDNLSPLLVDKSALIESIVNIAINAMHALPEGGKFTISTRTITSDANSLLFVDSTHDKYLNINLKDNGRGMTEAQQRRIFEPFFSTKGDAGTGLGMSQVYGFVTEHNGVIDVNSKIGVGTYIDIYLPISELQITETKQKQTVQSVQPANKTILVVDDEEAILYMVKSMAMLMGYKVLTVTDARDVLSILKDNDIDLLLSDIIMPGMDGYALVQLVIKHFKDVKIQLMSGYSDIEGKDNVPVELLDNILHKPFTSNQLVEKLEQHFI